jgi:hypothetical protein
VDVSSRLGGKLCLSNLLLLTNHVSLFKLSQDLVFTPPSVNWERATDLDWVNMPSQKCEDFFGKMYIADKSSEIVNDINDFNGAWQRIQVPLGLAGLIES